MEVLLGVSAGISAYKTAALASRLTQAGYGVSVMMTREAAHLIGPRTFQALTGRAVQVEMFSDSEEEEIPIPHIASARRADIFCIAPATANILGKAAHGIADDLLSTTILAFDGPVLFAPAMNGIMWNHPAVQRNVRQLREDGALFIGPEEGRLACGDPSVGRMAEPEEIFHRVEEQLKSLSGSR